MSTIPTTNPATGAKLPMPYAPAADVGTADMVFLHDFTGRHIATGRARRSTEDYDDRRFTVEEAGQTHLVHADSPAARHSSGVWTVYLEN